MIKITPPKRPTLHAEDTIISSILDGTFPPGSFLPGERELAKQLGITRPPLREALQRLDRDGWITVHQGKPSVVNDIWKDGGLNILSSLVRFRQFFPSDFLTKLLEVRSVIAPIYTCEAVKYHPNKIIQFFNQNILEDDTPESFARFDWKLHRILTVYSDNLIYPLLLNSFSSFYKDMAKLYFKNSENRSTSLSYYEKLLNLAREKNYLEAEKVTRITMKKSIMLWKRIQKKEK